MEPKFIRIDESMLRGLMDNNPMASVSCQLPIPLSTGQLFTETAKQIETVMMKLLTVKGVEDALHERLVNVTRMIMTPELTPRACLVVPWDKFTNELELMRSCLPEKTPKATLKEYDKLIELTGKMSEAFASFEFKIELTGDEQVIAELAERIIEEATEMLEDAQAERAEALGWKRGQTTCCTQMGYNPPKEIMLPPVHDPGPIVKMKSLIGQLLSGLSLNE